MYVEKGGRTISKIMMPSEKMSAAWLYLSGASGKEEG
jgi:hypothetical protein